MHNILLALMLLFLSGCNSTSKTYNKEMTKAHYISEPITLTFYENKHVPFHFILEHDSNYSNYLMRVIWASKDGTKLFDNANTKIKFLVNNIRFIDLSPIKQPKILSYDMNKGGHEEEAVFVLTLDELRTITSAKTVQVELSGKNMKLVGYFNKWNSFAGFNEFLRTAQ